jgi:hypothetical protein
MIRYEISSEELEKRIDKEAPGWTKRARKRTARFKKLKRYQEKSGIWSEVKAVYVKLQEGKCAYCERKLGSESVRSIEWDVEHYRPKSQVRAWKPETVEGKPQFSLSLGKASKKGYYLLPYHILNYAASCKTCNSPLKSDYFPIAAGKRSLTEPDPARLIKEQPFLPYPIDSLDEDPETLLTFQSYWCIPMADQGHRRNRALVTIAFFRLNDQDTLFYERAEAILYAWEMLERLERDPNDSRGKEYFERVKMPGFRHANCIRSFIRVSQSDPALAKSYFEKAQEYMRTKQARPP